MPIVSSQYWNMVHGNTPEEVKQDLEGMQTMRVLGKNMAWLLKSINAGKEARVALPEKNQEHGPILYVNLRRVNKNCWLFLFRNPFFTCGYIHCCKKSMLFMALFTVTSIT